MAGYILKRLLLAVPTLLGISLVTFILMKSIPGDAASVLVGERASPEVIEANRRLLGLDRSLPAQFALFLKNASPFRPPVLATYHLGALRIRVPTIFKRPYLGYSYFTRQPVDLMLAEKFPHTVRLALAAMLVAGLGGIGLGMISVRCHGRTLDRVVTAITISGVSLPVFWVGLILILIFAYALGWLPPSGMGDGALVFLVLPAFTLGSRSAAYLARITRSSMLEVYHERFVTTARAKGLPERLVVIRHVFRNALIPVVTLAGLDFGSYLNGSVLTETIFGWDGVGRLAMGGIMQRDYPVILGCVLLGAVVFVLVNIATDILYAFIDPRVRYE